MKMIALITALCALSACNAMEGLGKDIQNLGTRLEYSAAKGKQAPPPKSVAHPQPTTGQPQQTMQAVPVDPVDENEVSYPNK